MIDRLLTAEVSELLDNFPVVAVVGPRQVGKTTLVRQIADSTDSLYLDLELEEDRAKLQNPAEYLRLHQDKLVILDEIHRTPEIFQTLRSLVDEGRRAGRKSQRFLVLGSAAIELLRQSGESLAGRIAYTELTSLNALETSRHDPAVITRDLWQRGGFPDSLLSTSDRMSYRWRWNFIRSYLQRDIPQFGPRIAEETLDRFWTMLAHLQGQLLNAASISRSLGVDNKTVTNYLDLMIDLLLVRRLRPWHANSKKRLVKSPKTYIRDSGLLHALLKIESYEDLLSHPVLGDSWEGFVIENLLSVAPSETDAYFYRSSGGAELDLILAFGRERWAIEIKHSPAPKLSKGFHSACEDVKPTRKCVVHSGAERFPLNGGVEAISLTELASELASS